MKPNKNTIKSKKGRQDAGEIYDEIDNNDSDCVGIGIIVQSVQHI